jgi:hypothetical protein
MTVFIHILCCLRTLKRIFNFPQDLIDCTLENAFKQAVIKSD